MLDVPGEPGEHSLVEDIDDDLLGIPQTLSWALQPELEMQFDSDNLTILP